MSAVGYIEGADLVKVLNGEDRNATCVIDVRDADFAGGHIEGCLNIWAESFYDDDDVDELIKKHDLLCCKRLVLTCFVSQQRGPFCARRLASRLDALGDAKAPSVFILRGGMKRFKQEFAAEKGILVGLPEIA